MPTVELERTLVKSPPELWEEITSDNALSRWLGEVEVRAEPPSRLEWAGQNTSGVIELESSGWGTKVHARAEARPAAARDRLHGKYDLERLERALAELFDELGSSSLRSG